jgi:hypothetical protein
MVRVSDCTPRGPGFDSRRHKIFWDVVRLERGPLSLVGTSEEDSEEEWVAAPAYKVEYTAIGISHADNTMPFIRKELTLTSLTGGCRLVGIISRKANFCSLCVKYCLSKRNWT